MNKVMSTSIHPSTNNIFYDSLRCTSNTSHDPSLAGTVQRSSMKNNISTAGNASRDMKESQRALELRKFFAPHSSSNNAQRVEGSFNETLNNDGALDAYAETVLWRLKGVHAMVSLVDRGAQYFLAGAIRKGTAQDAEDGEEVISTGEWFGCSTVPTPGGLCENTLALDPRQEEYPCFIVNDLSKDERFASLPVVDGTIVSYRFYAGTPITTDHGVNIGSFFLFDDKPRDGISREQRRFLYQQATNVMRHLETKREAAERRRVALMSRGISQFLERTSRAGSDEVALETNGDEPYVDEHGQMSTTESEPNDLEQTNGSSAIAKETVLDKIRFALDQAADILRDSLELNVGGVVFLDTAVGYTDTGNTEAYLDSTTDIGSQVEVEKREEKRRQASNENNLRPTLNRNGTMKPISQESTRGHDDERKAAKVLAMSAAKVATWDPDANVLDAKTLQSLINTYPKGNVWYTDEEGYFTSLEQMNELKETASTSPLGRRRSGASIDLTHQRAEASLLARVFHGARQIVFLPLWDAGGDRWYAGCFVWSRSAVPVFTVDSEVAYLSAFTNSVMVEISRLDAITSNKMKSDFISSISHEFRSPLHGILASAELLRESKLDASQREFIATIQNCSGTLLDTINHVLDYSKINSFEKNQKGTSSNELIQVTNLALLCEDIINGMIAAREFHGLATDDPSSAISREFRPETATHNDQARRPALDIILDIEKRDWYYNIQAGALRRVVMNIFGNAQKYTETGHIMVQMRIQEEEQSHSNVAPRDVLYLKVRDSGRGMSAEYMERKLYHPFAQENSFAPGVGLGLSIVWSIVNQLGGKISIRSQIGKGTDVEITIPVERAAAPDLQLSGHDTTHDMLLDAQNCIPRIQSQAMGNSIHLSRTKSSTTRSKDIGWACIERYCSEWFGFTIIQDSTDLMVTDQQNEAVYEKGQRVLVVHDDMSYSKKHIGKPRHHAVGHICPPVGPFRLARCLLALMEQDLSPPASESGFNAADRATQTPLGSPEDTTIMNGIILTDYGFTPPQTTSNTPTAEPSKIASFTSPKETANENALASGMSQLNVRPQDGHDGATQFSVPSQQGQATSPSRFGTLTLPAAKRPETTPNHKSTDPISNSCPLPTTDAPATPSSSLTILAVDDNALNLQLLLRYLVKRKSDTIILARDGMEAISAFKTQISKNESCDVILMDISMPNMNGFEATRAIRGLEKEVVSRYANADSGERHGGEEGSSRGSKRAWIVALTGLASKRDREEAESSGFDDFLTKPISFGKIGSLLERLVSEKEKEKVL